MNCAVRKGVSGLPIQLAIRISERTPADAANHRFQIAKIAFDYSHGPYREVGGGALISPSCDLSENALAPFPIVVLGFF